MIQEAVNLGSRLAPALMMHAAASQEVQQEVLEPYLEQFFAARGVATWTEIALADAFHDLEFQGRYAVPIVQLYTALFASLSRDSQGRLLHSVRYFFLLDSQGLTEICGTTGIAYVTIKLADRPVAYLIAFPLARVLMHLRERAGRIYDSPI